MKRPRTAPPAEWPEAHFDRFTLAVPPDAVADCAAAGEVSSAVAFHARRPAINWPAADRIRETLAEYGAWAPSELRAMRAAELRECLLWVACCDIRERAAERD